MMMRGRLIVCSSLLLFQLLYFSEAFVPHGRTQRIRREHTRGSPKLSAFLPLHETVSTEYIQQASSALQHAWESSALQHAWASYATLLKEKPLETKSITAATLAFTGDALAQFRSKEPYDVRRGLAFLGFGALYTGCFQHFWFNFLSTNIVDWGEDIFVWGHAADTNVPVNYFVQKDEWWQYFDIVSSIEGVMETLQDPPSDIEVAAAKVVVNQFCVIPLVYMPLFFAITGAVGGLDIKKSLARARSLYFTLLRRNYLFWLPVQFFQFLVLPTEWQIPFVCVASLCWTIILSSIGGSTTPSASPSTVIAYETTPGDQMVEDQQEQLVTVMEVDAGVVNEMTDAVHLEDVRNALVPRAVSDAVETVGDKVGGALSDAKVGASASGLTLGLLASAADEAALGAAVGGLLGASSEVGVALVAGVGAGVGYLAARNSGDNAKRGNGTEVDGVVDMISDDEEPSKNHMLNSTATTDHQELYANVTSK